MCKIMSLPRKNNCLSKRAVIVRYFFLRINNVLCERLDFSRPAKIPATSLVSRCRKHNPEIHCHSLQSLPQPTIIAMTAVPETRDVDRSLTVSELLLMSRDHMKRLWNSSVWVTGELSNVRTYPSGHTYLTLKDERTEVSCVLFAQQSGQLDCQPQDGEAVALLVEPTIYPAKGRFQLIILGLRQRGQQGQLHDNFLQLKDNLRKQGWFKAERKRQLPACPTRLGLVVSLEGAAWRDVRKTLALRLPQVPVLVFPAPAQGAGASPKIAAAIAAAGTSGCDVVLVCRGGGSFEDLAAYNELTVAEAIHACPVPVVTGIGHETDETIADHVADHRAATPTAAAAAAVPDRQELLARLQELHRRLAAGTTRCLNDASQRADDTATELRQIAGEWSYRTSHALETAERVLATTLHDQLRAHHKRLQEAFRTIQRHLELLANSGQHIRSLARRLLGATHNEISRRQASHANLVARLQALNPKHTLARGFALVLDQHGSLLVSAAPEVPQAATVVFADGARQAQLGDKAAMPTFLLEESNA